MDDTKSLEALEADYWKNKDFPTELTKRCYLYRKIPVKDLSIEQLRTLIGQKIGLRFLLPKAFNILRSNILAEGEFYPGDLLSSVLHLEDDHWKNNLALKAAFKTLLSEKRTIIEAANEANQFRQLLKQIDKFISG